MRKLYFVRRKKGQNNKGKFGNLKKEAGSHCINEKTEHYI